MNMREKHTIKAIMFFLFMLGFSTVHAEPRGTPTTVTNDSSSPVVVTGTVTALNANLYKATGITTATVDKGKTAYGMSAACAAEFSGSRICSSEELILAPGRVAAGPIGAWVMPTITVANSGSGGYAFDISGVRVIDSTQTYHWLILTEDNTLAAYSTGDRPVLCCAP